MQYEQHKPWNQFSAITTESALPGFRRLHTCHGHNNRILAIAWSRDGQILSTSCADWGIRLWEPSSGKLGQMLCGHTDNVYSLQWSPDGQILASSSGDRTIRLWEPQSGELLRTLRGHQGEIHTLQWSPDGESLASSSQEEIRLWEPQSGELLRTLRGHQGEIHTLQWSPDGESLASSSQEEIRLWEPQSGKDYLRLEGQIYKGIFSFAWSPKKPIMAIGTGDQQIYLWDVTSNQILEILEGVTSAISFVCFSPDERCLASIAKDGSVRLWSCSDWESTLILGASVCLRTYGEGLAFHPNAPLLATAGQTGNRLCIWEFDLDMLFADCDEIMVGGPSELTLSSM